MTAVITQEMIDDMRRRIGERLKPKRLRHSLQVAERAAALALRFGEDPARAEYAGLAHDICKNMPEEEQLALIRSNGIEPDAATLRMPQLYHAIAGSCYLRRELGVTDEEILSAVRCHTAGRAGMSRLEEILFLADLTSADRDFPGVRRVRRIVDASLDEGMLYALRDVIMRLTEASQPVCTDSVEAYNYYILKNREGDGA